MTNEQKDIDLNNEAEEVIDTQEENTQEETQDENTQEKHQETPEAKLARLKRQTAQLEKKLGFESEPKKTTQKSNDLDYGQKAFLVANGVKENTEIKLVQNVMQETGKTLEQVLESKYFQAELKEMRELQSSSNATPTGKRSGNTSVDNVDYWLAKGELPPASEVELRRKVVNARLKKEDNKGTFYNS